MNNNNNNNSVQLFYLPASQQRVACNRQALKPHIREAKLVLKIELGTKLNNR
jgi:hypothetical protein